MPTANAAPASATYRRCSSVVARRRGRGGTHLGLTGVPPDHEPGCRAFGGERYSHCGVRRRAGYCGACRRSAPRARGFPAGQSLWRAAQRGAAAGDPGDPSCSSARSCRALRCRRRSNGARVMRGRILCLRRSNRFSRPRWKRHGWRGRSITASSTQPGKYRSLQRIALGTAAA